MSPRIQAPLSFEYILLGLVNEGPIHGYDLYKRYTSLEGVSLVWHIKQSYLYAYLDKLEAQGSLKSFKVQEGNFPLRKEYHITAVGEAALTEWIGEPVAHGRDMRQEFLSKLYFALKISQMMAKSLIEKQQAACSGWLETALSAYQSVAENQIYERMVFQFRISQIHSFLDWLANCRMELEK